MLLIILVSVMSLVALSWFFYAIQTPGTRSYFEVHRDRDWRIVIAVGYTLLAVAAGVAFVGVIALGAHFAGER